MMFIYHTASQTSELSRKLRVTFYNKQNFATNDSKILVNYRSFA